MNRQQPGSKQARAMSYQEMGCEQFVGQTCCGKQFGRLLARSMEHTGVASNKKEGGTPILPFDDQRCFPSVAASEGQLASVSLFREQSRKEGFLQATSFQPEPMFYVKCGCHSKQLHDNRRKATCPPSRWTVFGQRNTVYKLSIEVPSLESLHCMGGIYQDRHMHSSPATIAVVRVGTCVVSTALLSTNGLGDASYSWSIRLRWKFGNGTISVRFFAAVDAPIEVLGVVRWKVGRCPDADCSRWTRPGIERPGCGVNIAVLDDFMEPMLPPNVGTTRRPYILKPKRSHKVDEGAHQ